MTSSCWQSNGIGINTNAGAQERRRGGVADVYPADQLKLSLSGAYTDAKLTEDADPDPGRRSRWRHLPYTPKTSYSASADYEWPLADGRSAYLGASFSHLTSARGFDAAYVAGTTVSATCLVRHARCAGRLGFRQGLRGVVRPESHQR